MLVKYKDKKGVYLISTIHTDRKLIVKSKGRVVEKPEIVVMYYKTKEESILVTLNWHHITQPGRGRRNTTINDFDICLI